MDRDKALDCLREALGDETAKFRDGQWEAIDRVVNKREKLLVVQRTGWGKSAVYFVATRLLRDSGSGPTVIVSPLLALMRNQIDAARRLSLRAISIDSTNREQWGEIIECIGRDQYDVILISPERLANDQFREQVLNSIASGLGLLVIDEAHCISDWGHDFRPDYRRLVNVLKMLPQNTPVLGTTATANNRVVEDVQSQLGEIGVQRGELMRESLALETLDVPDQATRLAWLAQFVQSQQGTGIVYTLTKRSADQVSVWLCNNGIDAKPYYSGVSLSGFPESNSCREHLEMLLLNNHVKVLVATIALGMGYDKPDLSFVVHYQSPASIVGYYQQVGRAGRGIDSAVGVLLRGNEDSEIHEYFRREAFPNNEVVTRLLQQLSRGDGYSIRDLEGYFNLSYTRLAQLLKFLSVETPSPVVKRGTKWFRTPVPFELDQERLKFLTHQREEEWDEVCEYVVTDQCLMKYLRNALDDQSTADCGKCSNCLGHSVVNVSPDSQAIRDAMLFLRRAEMPLELKKQAAPNAFVIYDITYNIPTGLRGSEGRVLSRWADAAWGRKVKEGFEAGHYCQELVEAVADMIEQRWDLSASPPQWVTCIPSLRAPTLVADFAKRLADRLGLVFSPVIKKLLDNAPQREQVNRFHCCHNLDGVFAVDADMPSGPVLLVDDTVNSAWTLTVASYLLRLNGSGEVLPLALANTGGG
ncbi:MAG: ATP-dependent DNA helicase RecQ [Planctomycetaceae bacterium]|nr:ATP-dependent DNA helicase RecQ [Planctomycetaceae bacterium]